MKIALPLIAMVVMASPLSARVNYGGGHHTSSHGGHYAGGAGSSHRGGSYRNVRTSNRYGRHR